VLFRSNDDWFNPNDPDAEVTKMKDGRTHLAHKHEIAVDLDSGAVVGHFAHRDRSSRHDDRWFRSIAITRGPGGSERSDAGLVSQSLLAFSFRREGPFKWSLWHRWRMRSQIASARVGSPMYSCHAVGGSCPAMMTEPVS